jgi:hypothetical protein
LAIGPFKDSRAGEDDVVGDFPWFRTPVLQPPRRREEAAVLSSSSDRYDVQEAAQPIYVLHREAFI